MRIAKVHIENFRCIKSADITFPQNAVIVGDNNCGKSTLIEAIDLVLGPDRVLRRPVINEYDFFAGKYRAENEKCEILIEITLINLNDEQKREFSLHLEWLDTEKQELTNILPTENNKNIIVPVLRVYFKGYYNPEEDDFEGKTFYSNPPTTENRFTKKDKRLCGFLYLRTLRTGSRALSLEHGSLLDIILSLKEEVNPQMWEETISQLRQVTVANDPKLGITDILDSLQEEIHKFLQKTLQIIQL